MGKESAQSGTTAETSQRGFQPGMAGMGHVLERLLLGQLVQPPNTAISVPQQQAITALQEGPLGAANMFGIGAPHSMTPGSDQYGLQTRAQLGLPDRSSYMGPFLPTAEQVAQLGVVPQIGPATPANKRIDRLTGRLQTMEGQKQTPGRKARESGIEGRLQNLKKRQPERA